MRNEEETRSNTKLNTQFDNIQAQLSTIAEAQSLASKAAMEHKAETDTRIKALEDKFESFKKLQERKQSELNLGRLDNILYHNEVHSCDIQLETKMHILDYGQIRF